MSRGSPPDVGVGIDRVGNEPRHDPEAWDHGGPLVALPRHASPRFQVLLPSLPLLLRELAASALSLLLCLLPALSGVLLKASGFEPFLFSTSFLGPFEFKTDGRGVQSRGLQPATFESAGNQRVECERDLAVEHGRTGTHEQLVVPKPERAGGDDFSEWVDPEELTTRRVDRLMKCADLDTATVVLPAADPKVRREVTEKPDVVDRM